MRAAFDERRRFVVAALNRLPGVSCIVPKGAFYAFPNVKGTGWKAKELAAALLDRNLGNAIRHREVDGRRRQRDIERHAVVARGERLQIGADLVADIAISGHPVGTHDNVIDHPGLHQMAAGIVRDHRVRHAVLAELPGGERGALVARARLVDPDVDRYAFIVSLVDWGRRGAPVDAGEPAGVAVGEHVQARRLALAGPRRPRQADLRRAVSTAYYALFQAMAKDCADVLVGALHAAFGVDELTDAG